MNVALYGHAKTAWALDEQRVDERERSATGVSIGASSMYWESDKLCIDLDERTTPFGRRVRGRIVLHPELQPGLSLPLDARGEHVWWPIAPLARIEVDLPQPGVRFSGHGYCDANAGSVPLEAAFETWSWSRARTSDAAIMTYDVASRSGEERALALRISRAGEVENLAQLWSSPLRRTYWGLPRHARVDQGQPSKLVRSLEDGPFYARALIQTRLAGQPVVAMHESLAAHRLRRRWVRGLVGYRMRTHT